MKILAKPLAAPFTVVIDTRENCPYAFDSLTADARHDNRPLAIPTLTATLNAGDYSIVGHESTIAIERKSPADLFNTLGQGRTRFCRELERLAAYRIAAVVVESEWSELSAAPPRFSRLPPKNVFRSVLAYQQRWPSIHWWFVPGRRFAEITTYRILERYWRNESARQPETTIITNRELSPS